MEVHVFSKEAYPHASKSVTRVQINLQEVSYSIKEENGGLAIITDGRISIQPQAGNKILIESKE